MNNANQDPTRLRRRALLAAGGASSVAVLALAAGQAQAQPAPRELPETAAEGLEPAGRARIETREPRRAHEAAKAMETWAGSLAVQAATYAAPLVAMYNLRATVAFGPNAKAPPGQIWRFENIATPKLAAESDYVSPNVNVIYGFGFADLGQEPYILTAPDSDGRYYMIEICDMWTHAFAYPAGGPSGYKGGKFALVGPGWTGTLPADVTRVDCPTRWIELQPRVHVKDEADLPGAQKVLQGVNLQGLTEYNGGNAPKPVAYDYEVPKVNPKVASSQMDFDDPLQFWSIFAAAMNENPPPESEINRSFRSSGISASSSASLGAARA